MTCPHYPPPVRGGLERQAHELAVALRAQGVEVRVISGRTQPDHPAAHTFDGVPVERVPFPRWKWLRFPVTGLAILRLLVTRRRDFDVLHAHNLSWFGALSVLTAKALGKPVLAKLPTATINAFPEGSFRLRLFQRCDAIALLSPESVADFERRGYPAGRMFKITNGVATTRFAPPPPHGNDATRPLLAIFTGRLDPEKGLLDLLAVWPSVLERTGRPVRLVICGEGPQESELRAAIAAPALRGSVELRGQVAEVASALREADIFVLPSYVEGNSNAVLEAMATGLPIVSTLAGGTPFLVGPAGVAWLFAPRDRASLEQRLVELLTRPEQRQAAGEAMLRRARELFGIEAIAARYARVYQLLASGQRDAVGACSSPMFS
jgi:glycosyltransferase involved in cell wall biosynthesis